MGVALAANNATSTLASSITAIQTTISVQAGDAGLFPSPTGGDWFPVTITDGSGNMEIAYCTARSGVDLTVTRGQEGTSGFAFSAGARIGLRLTAGMISDLFGNYTRLNTSADVQGILGAANYAAIRTLLALTIGTDVQAYDAALQSIAALGTAADKMLYTTGTNTFAEATLTAFARTLLDDANAAAVISTLGLAAIVLYGEASAADWRAATADKVLVADSAWAALAEVTLTDAATIALDMSTFIDGVVTLGGNRTLGNPTATKVGQRGRIRVVQDGTGSRTLAYGTSWNFGNGVAPIASTAAGAEDYIYYDVRSSTEILAVMINGVG